MASYFYCAEARDSEAIYSGVIDVDNLGDEGLTSDIYTIVRDKIIESAVKAGLEKRAFSNKDSWVITCFNKV
ncbi:hypothetical protein D5018_03735 [Parashewanella curva]|uniref:Uncharacterized protein n=1 Tax=Parashewanella curva TaxID=2338552 RepID=A0A3L8Q2E4_9GAMM|nr:hypothetical protein [Parashewanella curva]RLV60963.1 hypothetical protein D5018_03735 [Parashewanella curva]